jgi:peptide/nickel transport system permease protein
MNRAAVVVLVAIAIAAAAGPLMSPFDGLTQDRTQVLSPPGSHHWLGTDGFGRDELTRVLLATRLSLLAGCLATLLALALGAVSGALAGYHGGWLDAVITRIAELFQSLPWFYLVIGIRALLPLSLTPAAAILMVGVVAGITAWPRPCRLVRSVVLSERERDYVAAARGFGASDWYLLRIHILPAAYSVILVQASLLIPQFVLAETTLSFLGLGVGEPAASLGNMLAALRDFRLLTSCPWMLAPALVLVLLSACCYSAINRETDTLY